MKDFQQIKVSDNHKIIKLNWVRISRTAGKLDLSRIRINNMGPNELRKMDIIV